MSDEVKVSDFGEEEVEDKPGRSRTWLLLLYPDTDVSGTHKAALEKLDELDWNYCGRVHDQDEGVKAHHHVVVCFKDGRQKADVAADLGIDTRWIRRAHSQKKAMRYLCHKDNKDKFQYTAAEIYGTLADKAIAQCSKGDSVSEAEGTARVIELIDTFPGMISYSALLNMVLAENCYPHYRRLGNTVFKLVDQHNAYYADMQMAERVNKGEKR